MINVGNCEQFNDKDKAFIDDAMKATDVPYGEKLTIKRFTGVNDPGDPARGIQPVLGFNLICTKGVVNSIQQQDILNSGGIYQLGDLTVELTIQLNHIDTIQQQGSPSQGDRIIYEGHEYRIVGKRDSHQLIGRVRLFSYTFRKIGDS